VEDIEDRFWICGRLTWDSFRRNISKWNIERRVAVMYLVARHCVTEYGSLDLRLSSAGSREPKGSNTTRFKQAPGTQ